MVIDENISSRDFQISIYKQRSEEMLVDHSTRNASLLGLLPSHLPGPKMDDPRQQACTGDHSQHSDSLSVLCSPIWGLRQQWSDEDLR